MITVVGIPLSLIALGLYALFIYLSAIPSSYYVGSIIFKDKIMFRKGFFGAIVYHYQGNLFYNNGIIDYVGVMPPTEPDNQMVFNELYKICGI